MKRVLRHITSGLLLTLAAAGASGADILSVRDTITDPHIVYPYSFEADTHLMMQNWYMQNYTELARNEFTNNTPVYPTDEELTQRLLTMPTAIEMPFNSIVKSYINMYVDRRRNLVENMLGMSTYYMPIFEAALEQEGVPLELKYLPIIESALNPNAVSPVGATGLWQFMLPTARGLGMEINSLVDERRDPVTSSRMAARYLKQLYDIYGDWSLAIAAYNCGPGNVNKALRRAGEGGKKDFWEIYPYLPAETRGYVPGFIAANYAMTYYDKHNISPALARRPILTDSVMVKKRVHFQQIADVLDIPVEELRTLNPQYRQDIIPGDIKAYPLVLPSHQALCYVISEDSIIAHDAYKYNRRAVVEPSTGASRESDDGKYIITEEIKYHKVKKGDTFSSLARRYGVTAASIKSANGIKTLRRGRTIKIVTTKKTLKPVEQEVEETVEATEVETPVSEDVITTEVTAAPEECDDSENAETETIEDFTADINSESDDNEADSDDSASDNPVDNKIKSTFNSRKASTPEPAAKPAAKAEKPAAEKPAAKAEKPAAKNSGEAAPVYHKVKKGETFSKIARRYGTTVKKLQQLNGTDGSKINVGQRIRVK
ncbi:MAG: transglycosylase SLT domain-containing protein [Barnesiella sp.]|nr:transglycosylase SLT domain-containing protein [Barnesiella sp.]